MLFEDFGFDSRLIVGRGFFLSAVQNSAVNQSQAWRRWLGEVRLDQTSSDGLLTPLKELFVTGRHRNSGTSPSPPPPQLSAGLKAQTVTNLLKRQQISVWKKKGRCRVVCLLCVVFKTRHTIHPFEATLPVSVCSEVFIVLSRFYV